MPAVDNQASLWPENVQRVGVLAGLPGLVRNFGVDASELLAAASLGATALDNPEATIPYTAMGLLLHLAADRTGCPHLGLKIGEQIGTESLGLIGELMRNAPTLGDALTDFATNQHRNAHGSVVYLLTDKHQAFFGYAVYQPNVRGNNSICDVAARAGVNLVSELSGSGSASISEVLFSRSEPQDATSWHRSFGVRLRFDADQTAVVFPRALLNRPVMGANPELRRDLKKRVQTLSNTGEFDTLTQVRRALRIQLLAGKASAGEISARLGMSSRTLNRRLSAFGVRFQGVLDETRCEFARQLLVNTRLSIGEIGAIVGSTNPGVFTRAFTRWVGMPPSEWRANIETAGTTASTN